MPEQQTAERQPEVAGPVTNGPGLEAPSFETGGSRSHEDAILRLQGQAGNRAVAGVLAGIQRAPSPSAAPSSAAMARPSPLGYVQRAPATETGLDPNGRAERARQAISVMSVAGMRLMKVNVEALAEALDGMTQREAGQTRMAFLGKFGWSLRDLFRGNLEIDGNKVVDDIGPKNRKRLLLLLQGTAEGPTVDPMTAMQGAEVVGEVVGSVIGAEDLGGQLGALAAVAVRDQNLVDSKAVDSRRLAAQAIQVKAWMDTGKNERIFTLVRSLSTPARRAERAALSDAYQAEFGEGLYIALTKHFKTRIDFERIGALWDNDLAKDDRLATEAHVEKVKKAERDAPKPPGGIKVEDLPAFLAKDVKAGQQRIRDAKAGLEAQIDEMSRQPAGPDPAGAQDGAATAGTTRTRLDAALGQDVGAAGLRYDIRTQTGVSVDDLLTRDRRPVVLADRLARLHRDGTIRPADIEGAMRELDALVEPEAARLVREAASAKSTAKPPPSPEMLRQAFFSQFVAEFETKAGKPLLHVLSSIGSAEERNRNLLLLVRHGQIDDVTELYFALRSSRKDLERVRAILGDKTRKEIRVLGEEYEKRFGQSLGTALLGTSDEIRRIRRPTPQDIMDGRVPKDLTKARTELDEKLRLLKGSYSYEPTGSIKAQLDFVGELAATRDAAGSSQRPGAVPVSDSVFEGLADQAGTQAEKEAIRGEAQQVLSEILGREITVESGRGLFARTRDAFGNIERTIVTQTRADALAAARRIDAALEKDPPDLVAARGQVTTLYIANVRMKHNLGIYEERTEEAFNAFVDVAVMVASTIATAGAGGILAGAVRATAATMATKLVAKGPDYLTSPELLADLRGGVFSAVGGKLADKFVGRFVQGWAKGIIDKADELGAGLKAQAAAGGARAVLYGAENVVSSGVSGGMESIVQGSVDPLVDQFTPTNQGMALVQTGAHSAIKAGRARVGAWQETRARQKAKSRTAAAPDTATAPPSREVPAPTQPFEQAPSPGAGAPDGPLPATGAPGATSAAGSPRPNADTMRALSPTSSGTPDTPARGGPRPRARRPAADRELPLTPDEFEVPPATMTAQELGDARLNSPRRLRNRQEALRREGKLPGPDGAIQTPRYDSHLLAESTGPTGGRKFAAEFTPIRDGWLGLPVDVRQTRIETVVNRLLADAGMPRVTVIADPNLAAGNAAFSPGEWKITISRESVLDPSPEGFGELADAVAHETRHALHIFRGVRAALHANPGFSAPVRPDILQRARVVNRRGGFDEKFRLPDPNRPGDRGSLAYGEAVDVIQEAFGPGTADRPTAVGAGQVARDRGTELLAAIDEHEKALAARPADPARVARADQRLASARRREIEAHNTYVRTAPEADAHRAGPAAGKAVVERLQHEQRVTDAESFAARARADLEAAVLSGDANRIRNAIGRAERMQARVTKARAALDALAPPRTDPDLAASLGAEPLVPAPREAAQMPPVPAPVTNPGGQDHSRAVPALAGSLRSVKPGQDALASPSPRPIEPATPQPSPAGSASATEAEPAPAAQGPGTRPAGGELPGPDDVESVFSDLANIQTGPLVSPSADAPKGARVSAEGVHELDLAGIADVRVRSGPAPLQPGDVGAAWQKGKAPPETWLVDPTRAGLTDPTAVAAADFKPNRTGFDYDVRNAQIRTGPGGAAITTPSGPEFAGQRLVGGARGVTLDPTAGAWVTTSAAHDRPYNLLGQDAPFGERPAADWHAVEQAHGPLTDEQRYALWFYSDDLSGQINPALRGGRAQEFVTDPIAVAAAASDLDRTMQPVPFDAIVHRKASMADFSDLGITDPADLAGMVGKSYAHAGYTSTAVEPGHWSGEIDIVIQVPKGTRGRYLGGASAAAPATNPIKPTAGAPKASMPGEMEFLIERGTSFTIQKAELVQSSGRWRVEVRVASQGVQPKPLANPVPLPGRPGPPGGGGAVSGGQAAQQTGPGTFPPRASGPDPTTRGTFPPRTPGQPTTRGTFPPRRPGRTAVEVAEASFATVRQAREAAQARMEAALKLAASGDGEAGVAYARAAVEVAERRVDEATAAVALAEARLHVATRAGRRDSGLEVQLEVAKSDVGYRLFDLGQARNQVIRATRVAEGLAASKARGAAVPTR